MSANITVIGSSNTDMVVRVARIPRPGETVLGGTFVTAAGGKGANQAVAAARAGGRVAFVARLGTDVFGDEARRGFEREGIDLRHVHRDARTPSGVALIFVGADGQNSIAVAPGANARLTPADVRKAAATIVGSAMLVLQLEIPLATVGAAAALATKAGVPVILNPAPAQKLPAALLRRVSILTPNETEAECLTGVRVRDQAGAAKAARRLHEAGVPTVIVTLGAAGAYVASPQFRGLVPGHKVKAVDTTAAGDVFNGALAAALTEGRAMREAVQFANAAAAISVTRLGAQPSAPQRREIECLLATRQR